MAQAAQQINSRVSQGAFAPAVLIPRQTAQVLQFPPGGANAQLDVDPSSLGEKANREQFEFWQNAAKDPQFDFIDADLFKDELSEDALVQDESWLKAAEILYDMDKGEEGAWAKRVANKGWTAAEADEKLGKWGLGHISDFNFQAWEAGKTALTIGNKSAEQQVALLYMMRAVEHKNMTWSGAGRGLVSVITDPANIAIGLLGLVASPFTGGLSLAGAAAAIGAKTGISAGVAKVGQVAFVRSLTSAVSSKVATVASSRVVNNTVTRAAMNNVVTRRLTSDVAVRAGRGGFIAGSIEGFATDRFAIYGVEQAGHRALGDNDLSYNWQRGALSTVLGGTMGWGFGRGFGAAGDAVGDAFRTRAANRAAAQAATPNTTGTQQAAAQAATPNNTGAGAQAANTAQTPGATPNTAQGGGTGGGTAARAAARTPASASSIDLPAYKSGQNWKTVGVGRSWKPHTLFTHWFKHRGSAPTDPHPILRKIINTVDDNMEANGLVAKINGLQDEMSLLANELRANPGQKTQILAKLDTLRSDFARDNAVALRQFEANVKQMRDHVADTYVTKAQWEARNNPGKKPGDPGYKTAPSGRDYVLGGNDGKKSALLHVVDLKTGQTEFSHVDAMDGWLTDVINITSDLQKPDFGSRQTASMTSSNHLPEAGSLGERLHGLSGLDADEIAGRLDTGLNRATAYAHETHKRLNPKGIWAQDREGLIRSLAEGDYNPYWKGRTKPGGKNLEVLWQQLDTEYLTHLKDDGTYEEWGVQPARDFAERFKQFFDMGYEQEGLYAARFLQLKRGNSKIKTFPLDLAKLLKSEAEYNTDPRFRHWVDKIEVATAEANLDGHNTVFWGKGRNTQRWYANQSQVYREGRRFTNYGTGLNAYKRYLALPGAITIKDELGVNPFLKTVYYFAGAHSSKKNTNSDALMQLVPEWNKGDKAGPWNNPVRRAIWRIGTGGITSKPGLYAMGYTGGLYALGAGTQYVTGSIGDGEYETDLGLKSAGKWVANRAIDVSDYSLNVATLGVLPALDAAGVPGIDWLEIPHDFARSKLNATYISEGEAMEALSQYALDANGKLVPWQPGMDNLNVYPEAGIAAKQLADADADITDKAILQQYFDAATNGTTVTAPGNTTPRNTTPRNTTPGNGTPGNTTPRNTTPGNGTGVGTPYAQASRPPSRSSTNGGGNFLEQMGSGFAGIFNDAFDNNGDGKADGSAGNLLNSVFGGVSAGYNTMFKTNYEGRDTLTKWLMATGLAFGGTMLLKAIIPGADKVPFLGLIMFGLILGYGSKFIGKIQGGGSFLPDRNRVDDDTPAVTPTRDVMLKVDHAGRPDYDWHAIRAVDDDNDGEYAAQMSMDGSGTSFVALEVVNASAVTSADKTEARNEGRHFTSDVLKRRNLEQASNWENGIAAVGHNTPGGKEVYMRPIGDNDNDRMVTLELAN